MSRIHGLALASLVALLSISLTMPPTATAAEGDPAPRPAAENLTQRERTERALNSLARVEFVDMPLSNALSWLKNHHSIAIRYDVRELADRKIRLDTPINLSLEGISLRSVFQLMLEPCGLTYHVDDAGVEIVPGTSAKAKLPAEERIRRALKSPTEVSFAETPLRDALAYLQDLHQIELWTDEKALAELGVAMDAPVTLSISGARLESVLNVLLTPLQLDYLIDDELLKITTHDQAQQTWQLQIYQVRDLLAAGFGPEDLQAVITSSVAPQSWPDNGGQASLRLVREIC